MHVVGTHKEVVYFFLLHKTQRSSYVIFKVKTYLPKIHDKYKHT